MDNNLHLGAARHFDIYSLRTLTRRRTLFGAATIFTVTFIGFWLTVILANVSFYPISALIFFAAFTFVPYLTFDFWNSLIGFCLIHTERIPRALPMCNDPLYLRTAVVMTIRNENADRAFLLFQSVIESILLTGEGRHFEHFVLSDTTTPDLICAEAVAFERLRKRMAHDVKLCLRRRSSNIGHKNGNLHEFATGLGRQCDLMIVLDVDSLMTGDTILSLVRLMQQRPRTAILQTLSVGLPTTDAFARIFQFGLRFTLRCLTTGATWWHGDSCQYWGHNCAIRIQPFATNCNLQSIPLSDHSAQMCHFSHDQIEAALLRRAGYAVQFLPVECGSFEGNPPTLPDYLHRHARWCRGNIENLRFCFYSGFRFVSRTHLIILASKFVGLAGVCILALTSALLVVLHLPTPGYTCPSAPLLYLFGGAIYMLPRVFGVIDAILSRTKDQPNSARLATSGLIFLAFHVLLAPLAMFSSLKALVSLLLGRRLAWSPHRRLSHIVLWHEALSLLWLETVVGVTLFAMILWVAPGTLIWFMPFLTGLILAIPFAVATSSRRFGEWLVRKALCATPEESKSTREDEINWSEHEVYPVVRK